MICANDDLGKRLKTPWRKVKCDLCDYSFYDAGNLRRHLKTHSGKSSLFETSAVFCASSHACDLKRRLKTHIGDKKMQPV